MLVIKNYVKKKAKKKVIGVVLLIIKPFIVPIIIILIFIALISSITDILYMAFDNDDKIDMKKELAYYDTDYEKERDKDEVKGFFESVWDFVEKIFGGGEISDYTDWPVERSIYNIKLFWIQRSSYSWCINVSYRNRYSSSRRF